MNVFDSLTQDLDWRESELGSLKLLLKSKNITTTQREVLLRAAWAMLYAHYEGYSKFCLTVFYDEANKRLGNCIELPLRTKAFALERHLKTLKNLPSVEMIGELEKFSEHLEATKPTFPEVDTKSNLWPDVMKDLLMDADIVVESVGKYSAKLKALVARRNGIAHGQKSFIDEVDYYLGFENVVYDVMYDLAYSIDDRLGRPPYSP